MGKVGAVDDLVNKKLYHGGENIDTVKLDKSRFGKTFYMSDDATYAKSYGGKNSVVTEMELSPKAKLLDLRKPSDSVIGEIEKLINIEESIPAKYGQGFSFHPYSKKDVLQGLRDGKAHFAELPQLKKIYKKMGYDGMITSEVPFAKNIGVWNKDLVKPTPKPAVEGGGIPDFKRSLKGAMQHRPTKGPPANDLLAKVDGDEFAPKDIYEHPEWYANGDGSLADRQSIAAIRSLRGNPNAMVTIYRASPKNELRTGDWVSLSKDYAKIESLAENVKVNSFRVKASDVNWAGDSLNEFGYFGKPLTQSPKNLIKLLETEGAYIQKHGKIPPNADMAGFKKSKEYLKYGTTERQQASAYYEYVENKLNEMKLSPKPAVEGGR